MVLPKQVREALRVGPGDSINLEMEGDRVVLSPVRTRAGIQKERGIWVYRSGTPSNASLAALIDESRRGRKRELAGE
jgi:AbrB family looped-hinge helix DNA binding protein